MTRLLIYRHFNPLRFTLVPIITMHHNEAHIHQPPRKAGMTHPPSLFRLIIAPNELFDYRTSSVLFKNYAGGKRCKSSTGTQATIMIKPVCAIDSEGYSGYSQ
jgi:hypothetical protein